MCLAEKDPDGSEWLVKGFPIIAVPAARRRSWEGVATLDAWDVGAVVAVGNVDLKLFVCQSFDVTTFRGDTSKCVNPLVENDGFDVDVWSVTRRDPSSVGVLVCVVLLLTVFLIAVVSRC